MNKKSFLYTSVMLALASSAFSVAAQDDNSGNKTIKANQLEEISVVASDTLKNNIDSTLPNTDVIQVSDLRDPSVTDLRHAFYKNPVVELSLNGNVGDKQQIRIRGFGENYTEMTVDGEPTTEFFVYGPYVFGGKNIVEIDTIKQIDVVKGRKSPKQSNGALAGTVNMETYNPSDLVDDSKPYYFSAKTGYTSRNEGYSTTLTGAGKYNNLSGLAIYTYRNYHELDNFGSKKDGTLHSKQNAKQHNLLMKGEVALDKGSLLLTGEHFELKQKVIQLPHYTSQKPYQIPTKRNRLSAKLSLNDVVGLDNLTSKVFWSEYKQSKGKTLDGNKISQRRFGIKTDLMKELNFGSINHSVLLGVGINRYDIDWLIKGKSEIRYLPKTKVTTYSLYAQDKIGFDNGFSIIPSIRVERKHNKSVVDDAYEANPALVAQKGYIPHNKDTSITPSIRIEKLFSNNINIFTSYTKGQKSADSSNVAGFDHGFGYIIPNPDLKDEKSDNFELGFSYYDMGKFDFRINTFYNKFKDFISYNRTGETLGMTEYGKPKSIIRPFNLQKAKVYGLELEANYALNKNLNLHSAMSWMKGSVGAKESHGVSLTSATPMTAILGIDYHQDQLWGAKLNWKLVGKGEKSVDEDGQEIPNTFRTPGYGLVDLTAWWKPIKNVTLSGGIYNVFNKKYWLSSDVNGKSTVRGRKNPVPVNMDKDTQPGRNFALNLKVEF